MSSGEIFDVVIIGAGAAGLGAARRLRAASVDAIVLEARERTGGRAHTVRPRADLVLDLGCGWLHSADRNPLVALAAPLGFVIEKTPAPWDQVSASSGVQFAERGALNEALARFEARLERAAQEDGTDRASDFLDPHDRATPMLNAFSSFYNGTEFDAVSVRDYVAYEDSGHNWRVREGYGALVAALNARVVCGAPVSRVDHAETILRVESAVGTLRARTVIVTVPTPILAEERLRFSPALPEKVAAASGLPLGLANKLFLTVARPEALPANTHLFGRADRAETCSYSLRPLGRPIIEVFSGGRNALALEREGEATFLAFAREELAHHLGTDIARAVTPLAVTAWAADPFSGGSYSHALPGHRDDRARLAAPVDDRLFFAGEAVSAHAFSTAHGAYASGVEAAERALRVLR